MGQVNSDTSKISVGVPRKQILRWLPEVSGKEAYRSRLANILFGDVKLPGALFFDSKLLDLVNNPDSNVADFVDRVKLYPELSVKIVQMSRSAMYGHGAQIESFSEACSRVGMKSIRNLIYASQMAKGFTKFTQTVDWGLFWTKSLLTARLSDAIVTSYVGPRNMGFVTGLVNEVGTLMLREYFPDDMASVDELVAQGVSLPIAEYTHMGFNHAHVSGVLCLKWQFPFHCAMGTYHRYSDLSMLEDEHIGMYAACSLVASRLADSAITTEGIGYFDSEDLAASPEWNYLSRFHPVGSLNIDMEKETGTATSLAHEIMSKS